MKNLHKKLVSIIASFMTLSSSYYINNMSVVAMDHGNQTPPAKLAANFIGQTYKCPGKNDPATINKMLQHGFITEHEAGEIINWLTANVNHQGDAWVGLRNRLLMDVTNGQILTYDLIIPDKHVGLPIVANTVNGNGQAVFNIKDVDVNNPADLKLAKGGWENTLTVEDLLEVPGGEVLINYKVVDGKLKNTSNGRYVNIQHKQGALRTYVFNENGTTAENAWNLTHPETFGIETENTPPQAPPPPQYTPPSDPPVHYHYQPSPPPAAKSSSVLPFVLIPSGAVVVAAGTGAGVVMYKRRSKPAPQKDPKKVKMTNNKIKTDKPNKRGVKPVHTSKNNTVMTVATKR